MQMTRIQNARALRTLDNHTRQTPEFRRETATKTICQVNIRFYYPQKVTVYLLKVKEFSFPWIFIKNGKDIKSKFFLRVLNLLILQIVQEII